MASPLNIKQNEAESWIELARAKKEEFGGLCNSLLSPPIEAAKAVQEYVEKLLTPAMMGNVVIELYKRKMNSKKLYDAIMSYKKGKS